jgi:hypothetical protein
MRDIAAPITDDLNLDMSKAVNCRLLGEQLLRWTFF